MKKVNEALNNPSAANSFHEGRSRREANDPEGLFLVNAWTIQIFFIGVKRNPYKTYKSVWIKKKN